MTLICVTACLAVCTNSTVYRLSFLGHARSIQGYAAYNDGSESFLPLVVELQKTLPTFSLSVSF